jgi:hypothetical protein
MTNSQDQADLKPQSMPDKGEPTTAARANASEALELGGRDGPEPTRYGDWELRGRCIDF